MRMVQDKHFYGLECGWEEPIRVQSEAERVTVNISRQVFLGLSSRWRDTIEEFERRKGKKLLYRKEIIS